jgi:hypothetical protein
LPAENIELHDSWVSDPPQLTAGEPVSRTLSLRATGLSGTQIPAIEIESPERTRVYPDTPVSETRTDSDKVYGLSRQTFTYIPGKAGELTIPAVEVPWWNTRSDERAVARLPNWELKVEPGLAAGPRPPVAAPAQQRQPQAGRTEATGTKPSAQETGRQAQVGSSLWPWLVSLLLVAVAVVVFLLRRGGRMAAKRQVIKPVATATPAVATAEIKDILPRLQQACERDDARAAAQALLELGRARWPDDSPSSLGQLAVQLGCAEDQIQVLDRALYAAEVSDWSGAQLWAATRDAWMREPVSQKPPVEVLEPLYPQSG